MTQKAKSMEKDKPPAKLSPLHLVVPQISIQPRPFKESKYKAEYGSQKGWSKAAGYKKLKIEEITTKPRAKFLLVQRISSARGFLHRKWPGRNVPVPANHYH